MAKPSELAGADRASVVAAAGFGKTELIAQAVGMADGVQLVLTHTHAGVDALRRRFQRLGVPASKYRLSTIAGCCLRYASSYPTTSGLKVTQPIDAGEWTETYAAGGRLFLEDHAAAVLKASFDGVFVDEYQDCTHEQHAVILRLADLLPCRVLGDPLQGIFSFGSDLVSWPEDVAGNFPAMDQPDVPWRWRKEGANGDLGDWLVDVRRRLLQDDPVELSDLPIGVVRVAATNEAMRVKLWQARSWGGSTVGILNVANRCHSLARQVDNFHVVEPLGCPDLMKAAREIDEAKGKERVEAVFAFARTCMTKMSDYKTAAKAASAGGPHRVKAHLEQLNGLASVQATQDLHAVLAALKALHDGDGVRVCRRELLAAMVDSIKYNLAHPELDLPSSAWHVRDLVRHRGRRLPSRSLGRPVLIKGLEFDHAIVLDTAGLTTKELYVALTRSSMTLTVLSPNTEVRPVAGRPST